MDRIAIVSPLKPDEWIASWEDKVIDVNVKKNNTHFRTNYFGGEFKSDTEFILGYHKAYESKSLSMDEYFYGSIEEAEKGCRIVGSYSKKKSVRLYLAMGIVMFLVVAAAAIFNGQLEVSLLSAGLFLLFLFMLTSKPKEERERLKEYLIQISADESFLGKASKRNKRSKSIRELATLFKENESEE